MIVDFDFIRLGIVADRTDRHRLAGVVTVNGQPGSKLIYVFDRILMILIASKWSNPTTGAWEFKGLPQYSERSLIVLALDNTGSYNAEVADYISQVSSDGSTPISYSSCYPPAFNNSFVKATSLYSATYSPHFACNPSLSLIGTEANNSWCSANNQQANQKFNIDLGAAKTLKQVYLENYHQSGTVTNVGIRNFSVYGTNSADAFNNTTYADGTNLTLLGSFLALEHNAANSEHPQYFSLSNESNLSFRYVVVKIADNYGHSQNVGIRRIELQEQVSV